VTLTDARGWLTPPTTFDVTLAGPSASVPVSFTIPAGTALGVQDVVTATVVSQGNPSLTDWDVVRVRTVQVADLQISQRFSEDPATVNRALDLSVIITNLGPDPATGIVFTDTLPEDMTFLSAQPQSGVCSEGEGIVTCEFESLGLGEQWTVKLTFIPRSAGRFINLVSVTTQTLDPSPEWLAPKGLEVFRRIYLPMWVGHKRRP